jgi:hypothetical protein
MASDGTVIASIDAAKAHDAAGNANTASTSSDNTVTYDTTSPNVTINQASGQNDPTNASPIQFTVHFNESVSDFATGDVSLSGTAGATTATVTGSGQDYTVNVSGMTGDGTVIATIAAGVAHDAAGNASNASTSTDNTVTYDTTSPNVTINQASGQSDPTSTSPIHFTVHFNESVNDFATGDVTLTGSAGATTANVTGSGQDYDVAVSGMTSGGTVIASIGAGKAHDAAGNANNASTSTDNTVTWIPLSAGGDSAGVNANTTGNQIDVLQNDTVPAGGSISSIQKSTQPPVPGTTLNVTTDQGGTASVVACGTCNAGQAISYSPATDYVGPDGFDYTITDGHGNYATAHVSINVVATGSLDSQMILEDSNLNDQKGSFNVLFAKSPKPNDNLAMRLKNTEPGSLHLHAKIFNHTNVNSGDCTGPPHDNSCTIDAANGNRVVAVLTIPDMPSNCGGSNMRPYTNLAVNTSQDPDCSNPGGEGKPAFSLQGGPDGKDAVHAHPDDKTDNMKVLVQYLTYAQYVSNGSSCNDNGASAPWSTTLPANGLAKCIKVSGLAIKVNHSADIDVNVQFRPTDTDWPAAANPALYFHAGFSFKLDKAVTFDYGTPAATTFTARDNIDTVGVGKKVTAVGGFIFKGAADPNPGANASGYSVRLFNTPTAAGFTAATPFGTCSTTPVADELVDTDGFYFIQSLGHNDPTTANPPQNLPSNVQYYVQVCNGSTPVVATLIDHKMADKEFVEWDMNANPAVPRPMSLAIKHQNNKPDNNDTIQVTWTEPLAEVTMCSTWGWDNTKDQNLTGVTIQIQDGGAGNDKMVVTSASACGSTFHFGTVDLGSPNYVTSTQSFTSSKIGWNHNGTLTFTLGGSGTTTAVTDMISATYTPDSSMTDTSGNAPQGTASDPSMGSQSNF